MFSKMGQKQFDASLCPSLSFFYVSGKSLSDSVKNRHISYTVASLAVIKSHESG